MVAQLEKQINNLSDAEFELFAFIGDRQRMWDQAMIAMKYGLDLCQSPIEQKFYVQWLKLLGEFATLPQPCHDALGGWGLSVVVTFPRHMWLTLCPQHDLLIEGNHYRIDFLVEIRLLTDDTCRYIAIELDGHDFHERTKEQAKKDKSRDRMLVRHGYTVLRFTGSEVYNDSREACKDVLRTVTALATK